MTPAPAQPATNVWGVPESKTAPTASPDTQTSGETPDLVAPPSVIEMLNAAGWTTPKTSEIVRTPDQLLGPGEKALQDYQYQISDAEWALIQQQYSSPEAKAAGFSAPTSAPATPAVPLMKAEEFSAAPMTWDEYEALSADQKAAVDFNTLLVEAREADLGGTASLTSAERETYNANVEKIFGKEGGSETLAPKTVELLSKIDFSAVGQDLDEFLSLERGITSEELENFKFSDKDIQTLQVLTQAGAPTSGSSYNTSSTTTTNYGAIRGTENLAAVDTAAIQKTRTMIENAMRNPDNALWSVEAALSGTAPTGFKSSDIPIGWGTGDTRTDNDQFEADTYYQNAYAALQDPGQDAMTTIWADLNDPNIPGTKQEFLNYVNARTRNEAQYGSPNSEMAGLRSAALIRDLVGLK